MGSFIGKTNVYVCPVCRKSTITIDSAAGTTPFMMDCRASGKRGDCPGLARSCMYNPRMFPLEFTPDSMPSPAWEWYRPGKSVVAALSVAEQDHVRAGGLLLRKHGVGLPRCVTEECGADPEFRVVWPGHQPAEICGPCGRRARQTAEAMSFNLVLEAIH